MSRIGECRSANLAVDTMQVFEEYLKHQSHKIDETITTLQALSDLLREFAKCTATLNAAKNGKTLDLTHHPLRSTIDLLYEKHPELFPGCDTDRYSNWDASRIDRFVTGTDPIVKVHTAEVSQRTTQLQVQYSDQTEIIRIFGKLVEEIGQHCKSILSKMAKIT